MKPESHTVDVQSLKSEEGITQTDEEEEAATKTTQPPVTVSLLCNRLIYSVSLSISYIQVLQGKMPLIGNMFKGRVRSKNAIRCPEPLYFQLL